MAAICFDVLFILNVVKYIGCQIVAYTGWRKKRPEICVTITARWRGVVGSAFRLKRSYSTPGPVSTAMGDCLRAGKPSRCEACQLWSTQPSTLRGTEK